MLTLVNQMRFALIGRDENLSIHFQRQLENEFVAQEIVIFYKEFSFGYFRQVRLLRMRIWKWDRNHQHIETMDAMFNTYK